MIIVYHSFHFNWVCNQNKCTFLWGKYCWCVIGEGITTQRGGAILGNRAEKVAKHCPSIIQEQHRNGVRETASFNKAVFALNGVQK